MYSPLGSGYDRSFNELLQLTDVARASHSPHKPVGDSAVQVAIDKIVSIALALGRLNAAPKQVHVPDFFLQLFLEFRWRCTRSRFQHSLAMAGLIKVVLHAQNTSPRRTAPQRCRLIGLRSVAVKTIINAHIVVCYCYPAQSP
jgi:hypothetical protein